jgi:hypothetical protein
LASVLSVLPHSDFDRRFHLLQNIISGKYDFGKLVFHSRFHPSATFEAVVPGGDRNVLKAFALQPRCKFLLHLIFAMH